MNTTIDDSKGAKNRVKKVPGIGIRNSFWRGARNVTFSYFRVSLRDNPIQSGPCQKGLYRQCGVVLGKRFQKLLKVLCEF